jgi:DNA-directed RNA polymerase subunit RPC12/RpoP
MAVQLPDGPADRHTCDYCNSHVIPDFRHTYGTDDHRAKRCPECDSWPRLVKGSAAGKNIDHPDPQDNPERTGGRELSTNTEVVADGGEQA